MNVVQNEVYCDIIDLKESLQNVTSTTSNFLTRGPARRCSGRQSSAAAWFPPPPQPPGGVGWGGSVNTGGQIEDPGGPYPARGL